MQSSEAASPLFTITGRQRFRTSSPANNRPCPPVSHFASVTASLSFPASSARKETHRSFRRAPRYMARQLCARPFASQWFGQLRSAFAGHQLRRQPRRLFKAQQFEQMNVPGHDQGDIRLFQPGFRPRRLERGVRWRWLIAHRPTAPDGVVHQQPSVIHPMSDNLAKLPRVFPHFVLQCLRAVGHRAIHHCEALLPCGGECKE